MKEKVKPYQSSTLSKKAQVELMFDTISGEYDGLNRVISLGTDLKWRKKVVQSVNAHGAKNILDIATGTGDLAIAFAQNTKADRIVGLDLSEGMLHMAQQKIQLNPNLGERLTFVKGDSEALPFEDNSFEAITVSFGVRNFENLEVGLEEIYRVLTPGGLFVVLETSVPMKFPMKQGYAIYTKYILPLVGRIFSKDKVAYRYLSESAAVFPFGQAFNNILTKIGFNVQAFEPQTFGVATIYKASKA
ncbi:MAG: bifunctional demethylmenaquinone methyltransferase/2-methoxy-6-polyprenyl-1,4-benzoquinol methylase UbiE [Flavobacteriaceae bacterium]|nr:bifunctional demethylmenaquinone methyltransferase/2-methoxy-6-polyprenyl-1,4-benzoquinol methylase UbiE [Flavobacteriaceae bacterium]